MKTLRKIVSWIPRVLGFTCAIIGVGCLWLADKIHHSGVEIMGVK